jgi:signal transduction histidine kinase
MGSDPNDFTSETLTKLKSDEILSVYIQDNGIGISEDNKIISNIRADANRKYGGTGLGLFISKELAILLGEKLNLKVS